MVPIFPTIFDGEAKVKGFYYIMGGSENELQLCDRNSRNKGGKCPVYEKGDRIVVEDPKTVLEKADAICIHALAPLLHYAVARRKATEPRRLDL